MISRAVIKDLVDKTETRYRECWSTLSKLKRAENLGSEDFRTAMLDFQPTLARALWELSEMYRELHQERRSIVGKKESLTPEWFRHRLALIAGYQRVIRIVIALGKRLGDAYAWLFYEDERKHLLEHFNHQRQVHTPPGIGGLGELKLIEDHPIVNGHLVLYHGITSFLRVGDISLFDLRNGKLAAVGELKTTQISDKELSITVSTVGPSKEGVTVFAGIEEEHRDTNDKAVPLKLPQNMEMRLKRQVTSIAESFNLSDSNEGVNLESDLHVNELQRLCKELRTSTSEFRKVGDGHLLFGTRFTKRSLASKLLGRYKVKQDEMYPGNGEQVQRILRKGAEDNEIWVGLLYGPNPEYVLTPGMVPLFWWPLDLSVIEAILFHDVWVFSVYNPAHLAAKLRRAGFEVESLKGECGLKVEKKLGDKTLTIERFDYFTHLITGQFWNEETVVEILSSTAEKAEREATPPHTKIEMRVQQHFG
jgi:hypothetical protein